MVFISMLQNIASLLMVIYIQKLFWYLRFSDFNSIGVNSSVQLIQTKSFKLSTNPIYLYHQIQTRYNSYIRKVTHL